MKKTLLTLCALSLCLLTACFDDFCGFTHGEANTTYVWTYTNPDGTTSSGTFTTNPYGQGSFDVPTGTDCNRVNINKKVLEAMDEMLDL